MDLYKRIQKSARGSRNRDVRIKVSLFLLAIKLGDVSEACARRGFSRKFYYKWWKRFKSSGFVVSALEEKTRRPKQSPRKTANEIENRIRWLQRKRHGCRQIEAHLRRAGTPCSRKTICHVMNGRKQLKRGPRARLKTHQKRYELPIPGQRMQMDVKYVPYLVNGKKAYSYVIIDECTRWRFARTYDSLHEGSTFKFMEEFEKVCPFPAQTIQTDNGFEFTYKLIPTARNTPHLLDEWCRVRGIRHRLIPPGVKELNGKVERSHRIDMQYFYWKAPSHCLHAFNQAQRRWMAYYNSEQLHGGIGFLTPLEKLRERYAGLKVEVVDPKLEEFKLKFLASQTISPMLSKQDRQIRKLEEELKQLLKKIA